MDGLFPRGQAKFCFGWSDPKQVQQWLDENPNAVGMAFVGRSNVGKSSLINALFGKSTARTSKTPGRTREINLFSFEVADTLNPGQKKEFFMFDLPGYGHAKVSKGMAKNWSDLMGVFFQGLPPSIVIVNIQDARHPHQDSDQEFQKYLKRFKLPTYLAFNKIDKLKRQKERAALQKIKPALFEEYTWVKQIHFLSAESRANLPQFESAVMSFLLEQSLKNN
jgi:GTP-binding protein